MSNPNQPPSSQDSAPAYSQPGAPAYGQPYMSNPSEKTNVLAIVSLVTAFFISLAAIITGHIALGQIKKTGEKGRGLAIAGLVLGYLGLVGGIIAFIAVMASAASMGVSSY